LQKPYNYKTSVNMKFEIILTLMKKLSIQIMFLFAFLNLNGQQVVFDKDPASFSKDDFILAADNSVADILLDSKDNKTVLLAAGLFSDDVNRVFGQKPAIKFNAGSVAGRCIIVGSIEESRTIRDLVRRKVIDVSEVKGKWESCLIQVVENPVKGVEKALVIAGSDRRGTAYGLMELSKQIGVSPWYYFADVSPVKRKDIILKHGRLIQNTPSVKYRGIFINDEMWGLRPWAMNTLAPDEGKGLGPTTYAKIFELLLRLKANTLWPAMHQQTKPFNSYVENKIVADKYGIIMGSSHIEPMLRNNIGDAEWDHEYPGEPWDYVKNKNHIYEYWEKRVKENGRYENMYTIGKRGKDDEAGSDITVSVLEQIFSDQRNILKKWVNKDVTKVPQVLIPYTEVLNLYNKGLKVPDDVIICWPDDNFGNIRQLPDVDEQKRSGGSGIYYHFQWLNGATTAYPWLYTTPLALTWTEMKKAYDYNVRDLWIVNVGDIKPAELGIDYFMQMAWDISKFEKNDPKKFLIDWATGNFGSEYALPIAGIFTKHFELGYARRPESMVMYNGRKNELKWDWFTLSNYNDEVQKRIDEYDDLGKQVDMIYQRLPSSLQDAFFQMVVYNVKGSALHNKKVLYAQKSHAYGKEKRAGAAKYSALAQQAENEIYQLIHHYNKEQVTAGDKWDHMASMPGPWGAQWHQWDMPPLSSYSGEGEPKMHLSLEGGVSDILPGFSVFNKDKRFIDLYNSGNGAIYWNSKVSEDWIKLGESSGVIYDEKRIWVTIDWAKAPKGIDTSGRIAFSWQSSNEDKSLGEKYLSLIGERTKKDSVIDHNGTGGGFQVQLSLFNPLMPATEKVSGFVESNGYISMEAEHFSRKNDRKNANWNIIEGLGRTGNSVTVLPANISGIKNADEILSDSPSLEYDIYTFTTGESLIRFNCIPSYPVNKGSGLRIAVALDNNKPEIVDSKGEKDVMNNILTFKTKLNIPGKGRHTFKIWMVDPGLVIDKIIIDTGGVKDSYLGPPESVFYKNEI
jgi:hypothetical protein